MYGCGEQFVGVASGSGWNLWVWLLGVVVRRYIDFLILLIPGLFCSSIPTFCSLKKCFSFFILYSGLVLLSSRHNVIIYLHNILYSLHRPFTVLLDYTRKCYSVDE